MSGLIRGKPLVWVRDGNCWRAESQFGVYYAHKSAVCDKHHWDLSPFDDTSTINEGESDTLELAQSACQADHDLRAMASVEVGPFEWKDISGRKQCAIGRWLLFVGPWGDPWRWCVLIGDVEVRGGLVDGEQAAITAAEQFVRQLVMGGAIVTETLSPQKPLRAFACRLAGSDHETIINDRSAGAAKSAFYHRLDADFPYTSIRCRCVGAPVTTSDITRTAEYRGVPFVRAGMRVVVDGCSGVIVAHNESANWNVLFDDGTKWAGQVLNCHPQWEIAYFAEDGSVIKDFRKARQ